MWKPIEEAQKRLRAKQGRMGSSMCLGGGHAGVLSG